LVFNPMGEIVRERAVEKRAVAGGRGGAVRISCRVLVGSSKELGILSSVPKEVEVFKWGSHGV